MLLATGQRDGKPIQLGILGDEGGAGLYARTALGLWDLVTERSSARLCRGEAYRQFGVERTAWQEEPTTAADMMQAYAQDAVRYAQREHGIALDLSEESLEQVEIMLDAVWRRRPRGLFGRFKQDIPEEQLQDLYKSFGGYIGEVMRRHFGGEWRSSSNPKPDEFAITLWIGTTRLSPPSKVAKRLTNGPEDNIPFYYKVFKEQIFKR